MEIRPPERQSGKRKSLVIVTSVITAARDAGAKRATAVTARMGSHLKQSQRGIFRDDY